jgi:hypothetical protein
VRSPLGTSTAAGRIDAMIRIAITAEAAFKAITATLPLGQRRLRGRSHRDGRAADLDRAVRRESPKDHAKAGRELLRRDPRAVDLGSVVSPPLPARNDPLPNASQSSVEKRGPMKATACGRSLDRQSGDVL